MAGLRLRQPAFAAHSAGVAGRRRVSRAHARRSAVARAAQNDSALDAVATQLAPLQQPQCQLDSSPAPVAAMRQLLWRRAPLAIAALSAVAAPLAPALPAAALEVGALPTGGALGGGPFVEGFVQGSLLIFFSELGDKTFFLALLLASSRPKTVVFAGTFGALAVMTVISVLLGQALHQLDELNFLQQTGIPWDDVLAVALLVVFGVQTLRDAKDAEAIAAEERGEAQSAVDSFTAGSAGIVLSTFALVFAAEWGDKSFLATIALSAATSPLGVTAGAVSGHGAATALAVLGGGVLSRNVSEVTLQYGGGVLFLVFAAVSAVEVVQKVV